MRPRRALVLAVTALALAGAACGDDDEDVASTDATEPAGDATEPTYSTESTEPASDGEATVGVATSDLGDILTSGGMTLYVFTPDNAGTPTCYDDCAASWSALLADGGAPTAGEGLDESLLGTAPRDDGGEQVTVNGWPVYFYAGDAAPGDTNGQGVGDVWWVIDANGEPIS